EDLESAERPRFVNASNLEAVPRHDPVETRPAPVVAYLGRCVAESRAWKELHGFPMEVVRIADAGPVGSPDAWRRVILDRQAVACALLLREGTRLLGFAVRPPGWSVRSESPSFTLENGAWQECFPELLSDASLDAWRASWLSWGQSRQLPLSELEPCS